MSPVPTMATFCTVLDSYLRPLAGLWGRLVTCGGLVTRLPMLANGRPSAGCQPARMMPSCPTKPAGCTCIAKNQNENLSDAEKHALAKILRPIKQQEH